LPRPTHAGVGVAKLAHNLAGRYLEKLVAAGTDLTGWTVVVDAAFGAAFEIGPTVFERLGARVIAINAADDGARINVGCGATDLAMLQSTVRAELRAATNGSSALPSMVTPIAPSSSMKRARCSMAIMRC